MSTVNEKARRGRPPASQIKLATILESRGGCSTPLSMLLELSGFNRVAAKSVLRRMTKAGRVQGLDIDSIQLTTDGQAWLEEVRRG